MAICNRDKDVGEQKHVFNIALGAVPTGTTIELAAMPWPCTVEAIKVAAAGLSGAPQWAVQTNRFVVGAGATAIPGIAAAQAIPAFSTSGLFGMALATSGSTLLSLNAGDVIEVVSSVSNTNMTGANVSVVVKKTQDIINHFGS